MPATAPRSPLHPILDRRSIGDTTSTTIVVRTAPGARLQIEDGVRLRRLVHRAEREVTLRAAPFADRRRTANALAPAGGHRRAPQRERRPGPRGHAGGRLKEITDGFPRLRGAVSPRSGSLVEHLRAVGAALVAAAPPDVPIVVGGAEPMAAALQARSRLRDRIVAVLPGDHERSTPAARHAIARRMVPTDRRRRPRPPPWRRRPEQPPAAVRRRRGREATDGAGAPPRAAPGVAAVAGRRRPDHARRPLAGGGGRSLRRRRPEVLRA